MKKLIIIFVFFIFFTESFAFYDSDNFSWANDAVNKWSSKGYISGYPDGSFKGNKNITRAEVVSVINKLNNSDTEVIKRASKDISADKWYFNDMGKAKEDGIISLDVNGNLRPDEYATREDVMVILSKLLNVSYLGGLDNAKVNSFYDSNEISSENYKRVAGIVEAGFVTGYSDNTLKPKSNITRAEFIVMLNNAIENVYTSGNYNNKLINGNIVINGENVEITNSEIRGYVFVLDGAKNSEPNLTNTKVSKGINSRVGNILIEKDNDFKTLSQYKDEKNEDIEKLVIAKLSYSEEAWTNNDVKVKIKVDNSEYKLIDGDNTIKFKENGEKTIEFEYKGDIVKVKARVNNIDKKDPEVTATYQTVGKSSTITVEIKEDGLSPIKSISCNGVTNKLDKETGIIEKSFSVTENGTYNIYVEDEAGNIGRATVVIADINADALDTPTIPDVPQDFNVSVDQNTSTSSNMSTENQLISL